MEAVSKEVSLFSSLSLSSPPLSLPFLILSSSFSSSSSSFPFQNEAGFELKLKQQPFRKYLERVLEITQFEETRFCGFAFFFFFFLFLFLFPFLSLSFSLTLFPFSLFSLTHTTSPKKVGVGGILGLGFFIILDKELNEVSLTQKLSF